MLGGSADDGEPLHGGRLAPVKLDRVRDPSVGEPALEPERDHEARIVGLREATHRRLVEMVVVVVGDEHEVDAGELLEAESGRSVATDAQQTPERAGALSPCRVSEEANPVELDEYRRVADPSHRGLAPVAL